jgi:hypothetical protein
MLKQEGAHQRRECKPAPVDGHGKRHTCKSDGRSICFQRAFDVPLAIQFRQALTDVSRVRRMPAHAGIDAALD